MYYALLTLFVIVSILLIILALLQKGRGDVGAAFGGAMGQSIFGAGGVDTVLTKATYWLGGLFLVLAILLSIVPREEKGSIIEREIRNGSETAPSKPEGGTQEGRRDNTGSPPQEKTR
ncbi:preprotein translocase subunit SecG [Hydrogenivirga sp. 128-5-R1-1]|uniref:preprotein translocase subunit SecG n=1 Tax=Hydrogenivirga sp. 128-5-R1-1 TaxID=392423 RepID=UPI00015F2C86|nr:preprotein translocase subunit SecG [Hydrogenivirga sp. 128-5-R1-1]EDP74642.1 protein export membrane protein SecG [Hydrogenivirga sp. 128-5-R1-1]